MKLWEVDGNYASALVRAETKERALELAAEQSDAFAGQNTNYVREAQPAEGEGVLHYYVV